MSYSDQLADQYLTITLSRRLRALSRLLFEAKSSDDMGDHVMALEYMRAVERVLTISLKEITTIRETMEAAP